MLMLAPKLQESGKFSVVVSGANYRSACVLELPEGFAVNGGEPKWHCQGDGTRIMFRERAVVAFVIDGPTTELHLRLSRGDETLFDGSPLVVNDGVIGKRCRMFRGNVAWSALGGS
jgi:hypothetical protein